MSISNQPNRTRVVVTGASGFIGSWIARYLESNDFEVVCLVRNGSDLSRLDKFNSLIVKIDEKFWPDQIAKLKPEVLILADWAGVAGANKNSLEQFDNVERWRNLAEVSIVTKVKLVIALGSQAELGSSQIDANENHRMNPITTYGEAKVQAFHALSKILTGSSTELSWVRLFSVYGPQNSDSWIIPNILKAIRLKQRLSLTSCEQSWNFLHVYDLSRLIKNIIVNSNPPNIINAAHPESRSLKRYIELIVKHLGGKEFLGFNELPDSDLTINLKPNTDLAMSLNWFPQVDWEVAITQIFGKKIENASFVYNEISNLC
jgi:nucleoside-diphosphate-sugar epimerase